jgi:hypothetical protein
VPEAVFDPDQAESPDAVQDVAAGVVLQVKVGVRVPSPLTLVDSVKLPVLVACAYRKGDTNNNSARVARKIDFIVNLRRGLLGN